MHKYNTLIFENVVNKDIFIECPEKPATDLMSTLITPWHGAHDIR